MSSDENEEIDSKSKGRVFHLYPIALSCVEHLVTEELAYEITVRGVVPDTIVRERRTQLRNLVKAKAKGSVVNDPQYFPVTQEIVNALGKQVQILGHAIDEWTPAERKNKAARMETRLNHYLYRAMNFPDDDENVKTLKEQILSLIQTAVNLLDESLVDPEPEDVGAANNLAHDTQDEEGTQVAEGEIPVGGDVIPSGSPAINPTPHYIEDSLGEGGTRLNLSYQTRFGTQVPQFGLNRTSPISSKPGILKKTLTHPEEIVERKLNEFGTSRRYQLKAHQWGLKFSGEPNTLSVHSFLERLELKLRVHQTTWDVILQNISDLLEGVAYSWYLSRIDDFSDWRDFQGQLIEAFGIPNYQAHTLRKIANTKQGPNESVTSYMSTMRILFRRCPEPLSTDMQVSLVIGGSLPKYQDLLVIPPLATLDEVEHMLKRLEISRSASTQQYGTLEPDLTESKSRNATAVAPQSSGTRRQFKRANQPVSRTYPQYPPKSSFIPQNCPTNYQAGYPPYPYVQNAGYYPNPVQVATADPVPQPGMLALEAGPSRGQSYAPRGEERQPKYCYGCGKVGKTLWTCDCRGSSQPNSSNNLAAVTGNRSAAKGRRPQRDNVRKLPAANRAPEPPILRVNQNRAQLDIVTMSPSTSTKTNSGVIRHLQAVQPNDPHSRLFVNLKVLGTNVLGLIDSGAAYSYMSKPCKDRLAHLNLSSYQIPEEGVVLADGYIEQISNLTSLPVQLYSKGILLGVRCLPTLSSNLVLGMDFIRAMQMVIDAAGGEFYFKEDPSKKYSFYEERPRDTNVCAGIVEVTQAQKELVNAIVNEAKQKEPTGKVRTNRLTYEIKLTDSTPIKQKPYPVNPKLQDIINKEVDSMLADGVIQPSESDWSNPLVMVRKQDNTFRPCLDFRKLNAVIKSDNYPLPNMNIILNTLESCKYLSKIDLKRAFWLIPLTKESMRYTAFQVPGKGFYEFTCLSFGLKISPPVFQRLIDEVIGPDLDCFVKRYLDDLLIATETYEQHVDILSRVLDRLRDANLQVNWDKSDFLAARVEYLGYIVDSDGTRINPAKTSAIVDYPRPHNVKQLRRILGMIAWFKRFIPNYSKELQPMTKLLKKGQRWTWGPEQDEALQKLKEILTSPPVLARPDWELGEFRIETDASILALGTVLTQKVDGQIRVIEYASRSLTKSEKNYTVTELECLAVVFALKKFRPYVEGGYKIKVITDHRSLKWLFCLKYPTSRLARWAMQLQGYDIEIEHRSGSLHYLPDALSRVVYKNATSEMSDEEDEFAPLCAIRQLTAYETWYLAKYKEVRDQPDEHPAYHIQDSLLYHHRLDPLELVLAGESQRSWKLIPAPDLLQRALLEHHDVESAGHPGIIKMYKKMSLYYYWPGMYEDIANYVRACKTCRTTKPSNEKPAGKMCIKKINRIGEVIYADFMGPYPVSSSLNKYILVFQDEFSKYVEIVALRNASANTVAQQFKKLIVYKYGVPRKLVTDNGSHFANKTVAQLAQDFGFEHVRIPPYSPQINIVERTNRTIKQLIRSYIDEKQLKWDAYLPEFQFAINSSPQTSTGYSPNLLMFGRDVEPVRHIRREVEVANEEDEGPITDVDYPSFVKSKAFIKDLHELVKRNQIKASQKQAFYYDKRRIDIKYAVGEKCFRRNFRASKAEAHYNASLDRPYCGPYVVAGQVSPVVYTLQDLQGNLEGNYHIKDLRKYSEEDEVEDSSM